MKINNQYFALLFVLCSVITSAFGQNHPLLILTKKSVAEIRSTKAKAPLFEEMLAQTKKEVDAEIELGIFVPIPKDMAGGYTHERHKLNLFILQKAGNLFQITGDEKYAVYIRAMLMEYAKVYPTLGQHPTNKSYANGKLFWQALNDANWLVYVSQAYDCIYDWLPKKECKYLNKTLFRPFADYLSIESPQFFNRIHNHSTWGNAAVGMIGLVMDDKVLIERALYGLKADEVPKDLKDNDGGLIKLPEQEGAGFFAQLDNAFSPDGYYTEGPYYQRYAISPFILFAKALANNRPDLKIFEYRNDLLKKSVYALLYQADVKGQFFPINDAQKGMSIRSRESISAVDIAYDYCGKDPKLLSVAIAQNKVELDGSGFAVAQGIALGKALPFQKKSIELTDGKDGTEGAFGILRGYGKSEICLAFKYTAQGLGHGHYDKLSYSLYDEAGEVIQDYGAARWVNIDQKQGGRYLPENKTWAKQTIAHNTLTINEKSHFGGVFEIGNANHSDRYFFNTTNENFQIASAKELNAYEGVSMHRTMALMTDSAFRNPILIDIYRVENPTEGNQYDFPTWFQGHLMSASFDYKAELKQLNTLGNGHGYEHIWKEATGKSKSDNAQVTWFSAGHFYSITSLVSSDDELIFARLGANDPEFNLRHDPAFIIRKKEQKDAIFVSVVEAHGDYNPVEEVPHSPYGTIASVELLHNSLAYTAIRIKSTSGKNWTVAVANQNNDTDAKHQLAIDGQELNWTGNYILIKDK